MTLKQTKQQVNRYSHYRDYLKNHGCRSLYQHYSSYSSEKAVAWQRISERKCDEDGFAFTIVGGGLQYFSTGYLRYVEGNVELVYDYPSGTDRIQLTPEQRVEISKVLCRTV